MDEIVAHRTTKEAIPKSEGWIDTGTGTRRRVQTTKGWELCVCWKNGSETWTLLKDLKESYLVQTAEYAVEHRLSEEPAFAWWVKDVLKKRNRILSKVKTKYWQRTHKFGIEIPRDVNHARAIDLKNGNRLWGNAIREEMDTVGVAFEVLDCEEKPDGYQDIKCHMIFDVKLGENFRRKARFVAGGHKTVTPASITYSSVVSRDLVRICLMLAA